MLRREVLLLPRSVKLVQWQPPDIKRYEVKENFGEISPFNKPIKRECFEHTRIQVKLTKKILLKDQEPMATSTQFVLFGVNHGNIGGRGPRKTAVDLCQKWNTTLKEIQPALHIIPGFRHTGNFLLAAEKECTTRFILDQLTSQTGGQFAVFTAEEFLEWLNQLNVASASVPTPLPGRRATPGVVMALDVNGGIPRSLPPNEKRQYTSFAKPRVLGVWKFDILRENGKRLDNRRREGGWGAIAVEMKKHFGGIWTARALSTPNGLAKMLPTL